MPALWLMPNETIYVSDEDLPIYDRAQDLSGGNLSAAISAAIRRYVEVQEGRQHGYDEIIVQVGAGAGRKVASGSPAWRVWALDQHPNGNLPGLPEPEGQVRRAPRTIP
jgi:hypothetical protein